MLEEPRIAGLSYAKRKRLFFILLTIFVIALPALIFHTSGYRLDFGNEDKTIVSTGGMYITTENLEVQVYMDGEQVDRPRLFRNAYYIQNIEAGMHGVVVQGEGLNTWVKELPVDAHLVIEAAAFNTPQVPRVRPVTEYMTTAGEAVFASTTANLALFNMTTTSEPYRFATRIDSLRFEPNEEFEYVASLFGSTTQSKESVFERIVDGMGRFGFATTTTDGATSTATTTQEVVERGELRLIERSGEIYAKWMGDEQSIPYYFCINETSASTTVLRYGQHVADAIEEFRVSTTTPLIFESGRVCRPEIRIDRKWQEVYFYDFFPRNPDLVLLQLEDGLYLTEIDDRAWQNTQLLYPGEDIRVVVENDVIYAMDGEHYFEVLTELEE